MLSTTILKKFAMTHAPNRVTDKAVAVVMMLVLLCATLPSQEQSDYLIHVQSDLVLVNVTVRDKSGKFVAGLKPENFTILEDNRPQKVVSFDVENVDAVPPPDVAQAKPLQGRRLGQQPPAAPMRRRMLAAQFKDRRLIVLFFDLLPWSRMKSTTRLLRPNTMSMHKWRLRIWSSIVSLGSSLPGEPGLHYGSRST